MNKESYFAVLVLSILVLGLFQMSDSNVSILGHVTKTAGQVAGEITSPTLVTQVKSTDILTQFNSKISCLFGSCAISDPTNNRMDRANVCLEFIGGDTRASCEIKNCLDTDGVNVRTSGKIYDGTLATRFLNSSGVRDQCLNSTHVEERYCKSIRSSSAEQTFSRTGATKTIACPRGTTCNKGACMPTIVRRSSSTTGTSYWGENRTDNNVGG